MRTPRASNDRFLLAEKARKRRACVLVSTAAEGFRRVNHVGPSTAVAEGCSVETKCRPRRTASRTTKRFSAAVRLPYTLTSNIPRESTNNGELDPIDDWEGTQTHPVPIIRVSGLEIHHFRSNCVTKWPEEHWNLGRLGWNIMVPQNCCRLVMNGFRCQ